MAETVQTRLMTAHAQERTIRSFARVMAIALVVIGLVLYFRHKQAYLPLWGIAVLFYSTGILRPSWLVPVYVAWMKLAEILSWINTRILLCIVFYVILTPVSLGMRLFRFDPLERRMDKSRASYWISRTPKGYAKSEYERLY